MYLCLILLDFKVVNVALYNTENKSITFMPSKKFIWPGKDIMHWYTILSLSIVFVSSQEDKLTMLVVIWMDNLFLKIWNGLWWQGITTLSDVVIHHTGGKVPLDRRPVAKFLLCLSSSVFWWITGVSICAIFAAFYFLWINVNNCSQMYSNFDL